MPNHFPLSAPSGESVRTAVSSLGGGERQPLCRGGVGVSETHGDANGLPEKAIVSAECRHGTGTPRCRDRVRPSAIHFTLSAFGPGCSGSTDGSARPHRDGTGCGNPARGFLAGEQQQPKGRHSGFNDSSAYQSAPAAIHFNPTAGRTLNTRSANL